MVWEPPGRNCGACGCATCTDFLVAARKGQKDLGQCPYYPRRSGPGMVPAPHTRSDRDILGFDYDFIVRAFPNEPSARRYIQPFRADLVDRWGIVPGDILRGRPIEPACPIQHVLRVISVDPVTGILACHTVGPVAARSAPGVLDIRAYHEIGFEGIAETVRHEPVVGFRMRFLPANCMRQMVHSGVVQMVLNKSSGTHVLIEDIQMHGKREKLKDITIRPGDSVSIEDASGARKTVLIDGIRVHASDGTVMERSREDAGQGGRGCGPGSGQRHRHDHDRPRHDDDD
ncbi:(Fe-S)-binding protein [uncultured Methanoregula sp.]|uniref:(Fe-S)-binding protein n=1 Tax=uncultured Methanoregula sp. TaxID=1005933 RepID=UPI002AAB78F2|nr:(Fe-S)-binding protein [uncultured Methanoregula sp.]